MREWIIFALCLGVGGHVALGVMLHAPDLWPWRTAGFYGLLSGLVIYAVAQGIRGVWKIFRAPHESSSDRPSNGSW